MNREKIIQSISFFPTIAVKVTALCNMNCGFCCEPNKKQDAYDFDDYKRIIEIVAAAGAKRICITGGEPLLYPDIKKFMVVARKHGLHSVLLTADGDSFMKSNLSISLPDMIRFSVHGLGSLHDEIVQRNGAFVRLEKAVKKAISERCFVSITTVVTKSNMKQLLDIGEWCRNLGVKRYYLFGLMRSGNGVQYIDSNGVCDESFDILVNQVKASFSTVDLEVRVHANRTNAECIIIYGNGDTYVDPYHKPPYQKKIGNIFIQDASEIYKKVINDQELSIDYYRRILTSSVFDKIV